MSPGDTDTLRLGREPAGKEVKRAKGRGRSRRTSRAWPGGTPQRGEALSAGPLTLREAGVESGWTVPLSSTAWEQGQRREGAWSRCPAAASPCLAIKGGTGRASAILPSGNQVGMPPPGRPPWHTGRLGVPTTKTGLWPPPRPSKVTTPYVHLPAQGQAALTPATQTLPLQSHTPPAPWKKNPAPPSTTLVSHRPPRSC